MSDLGYSVMLGFGRRMHEANLLREQREHEAAQQADIEDRADYDHYRDHFEKQMADPNALPSAQAAAADAFMQMITRGRTGMKKPERAKLMENVTNAAKAERARDMLTQHKQTITQQGAQANQAAGTTASLADMMSSISPAYAGIAQASRAAQPVIQQQTQEQANAPVDTSGADSSPYYTLAERRAQQIAQLKAQKEIEQEYRPDKWLNVANGGTAYNTETGQRIDGAPKVDMNRSPLDVLNDPSATPEQKANARWIVEQGHPPKADKPVRYHVESGVDKSGNQVQVLTDLTDPSAPPIIRPWPGGVSPKLSDMAMDRKAQAVGTLQIVKRTLDLAKSKAASALGPIGSAGYAIGKYTSLFGGNTPEEVELRTNLAATVADELHKLSGAAISPSEYSRLRQFLPAGNESPQFAINALTNMYNRLNRILQIRYGPNGKGDFTAFQGDVDPDSTAPAPSNAMPQRRAPIDGAAPVLPGMNGGGTSGGMPQRDMSKLSDDDLLRIATGGH